MILSITTQNHETPLIDMGRGQVYALAIGRGKEVMMSFQWVVAIIVVILLLLAVILLSVAAIADSAFRWLTDKKIIDKVQAKDLPKLYRAETRKASPGSTSRIIEPVIQALRKK